MPEFQSKIDDVYSKLQLSNSRRALLQPLIEKNIHIIKEKGQAGQETFEMNIVDGEGKKQDILLEDFITQLHNSLRNDGTPVLRGKDLKKLTNKQLEDISTGKLGINIDEQPVPLENAIKGSEILQNRDISLEDIAFGKTKVDINF